MSQRVAILGASQNHARFSYRAFKMLQEYGHEPLPVSPKMADLEGVRVVASLDQLVGPIDTLTMYVGAETSQKLQDEILRLKPRRVIFNPGSENSTLAISLRQQGILVQEACTLVLLQTGRFD